MPVVSDLPDDVIDRLAENRLAYGRYLMVSWIPGEARPQIITRGLTQMDIPDLHDAVREFELTAFNPSAKERTP